MEVRICNIDSEAVHDILCPSCIYWEDNERFRKVTDDAGKKIKRKWFEATSTAIGPCGKLIYADEVCAAYCQYAPPLHLPYIRGYDTLASHVDPDAIFISCLTVREEHRGQGLGTRLLQEVTEECRARGYSAIETFSRDDSDNNCSGPTRLYLKHGFRVIATWTPGATLSLVRLDIS